MNITLSFSPAAFPFSNSQIFLKTKQPTKESTIRIALRNHQMVACFSPRQRSDFSAFCPHLRIIKERNFATMQTIACISSEQGLNEGGIKIFASQLHTHLTGRQVFTKHYRHGIELPELNRDNHYSPHYQEIRKLPRQVHVLPVSFLTQLRSLSQNSLTTPFLENLKINGMLFLRRVIPSSQHAWIAPPTETKLCW